MATHVILYIILAGIVALGVSLFYYFYKKESRSSLTIIFSLLRFISLYALLILLINPSYTKISYNTVKPVLAIAVDNSASITYLKASETVKQSLPRFRENKELQERFDIDTYSFGTQTQVLDSLTFAERQTNIARLLSDLESVYRSRNYVPLLITDGNTTVGENYRYTAQNNKKPLYILAAGDTLVYDDLKITDINVNRYAYQGNEFPVEIITTYKGNKSISSQLEILSNDRVIYKKPVKYSEVSKSQVVTVYLNATAVGTKQYKARLVPISDEKNTINNAQNFAVEVIDQKNEILIISSITHPDLGALKKSITSNKLREVSIEKPDLDVTQLNDYELVIVYQPNTTFKNIYSELDRLDKNRMTVLGPESDLLFLNSLNTPFDLPTSSETDDAQAILNTNFSAFQVDDFDFNTFPPLQTNFGELKITGNQDVVLYQKIAGIATTKPMLAVVESTTRREVLLAGSGIWQWRAKSFRDRDSFEDFDNFIDKIIQYAASSERKERLRVDYETFYYGGSGIKINAQYVDRNYIFDATGNLNIQVRNSKTQELYESPLVVKGNSYSVVLNDLKEGVYNFTISVNGEPLQKSGTFTVVPYEIENQYQNADWSRLKQVAQETGGMIQVVSNEQPLIDSLLRTNQYTPIQESSEKIVPLIDFKIILFIIVACLAIEWFLRKYNGLI